MQDPTVLMFNHIPKTAGSTFRSILWQVFGGHAVFMTTNPGEHKARLRELNDRLKNDDQAPAAIVSHAGYGLHDRLPVPLNLRHITFLREPTERLLSHYRYQIQRGKIPPATTQREFTINDIGRSYNVQVAFLSGVEFRRNLDDAPETRESVGPEQLQAALENLDKHDIVGITDRFDETMLALRRLQRWPLTSIVYRRMNVGRRRRVSDDLSARDRRLVFENVSLDMELYEHGLKAFDVQLAHARITDREVLAYRRLNRVAAPVLPAAKRILRPARGLVRALMT